jgi:hypothetical protein
VRNNIKCATENVYLFQLIIHNMVYNYMVSLWHIHRDHLPLFLHGAGGIFPGHVIGLDGAPSLPISQNDVHASKCCVEDTGAVG